MRCICHDIASLRKTSDEILSAITRYSSNYVIVLVHHRRGNAVEMSFVMTEHRNAENNVYALFWHLIADLCKFMTIPRLSKLFVLCFAKDTCRFTSKAFELVLVLNSLLSLDSFCTTVSAVFGKVLCLCNSAFNCSDLSRFAADDNRY
jgi:hypothetical protein